MRWRPVLLALGDVCAAAGIAVGIVSISGSRELGHVEHSRFELAGDSYPYAVDVPSSYRAAVSASLVVVLHGCSTTPDQQAAASAYGPVAERGRFVVLLTLASELMLQPATLTPRLPSL